MKKIGKKLLIIDDEYFIRSSLESYFKEKGYNVFLAENGKIGLELFEKEEPDIVLLDLNMQEISGFEVLTQLKDKLKKTPVIIISGTGEVNDAAEAISLGAWDFITKPFESYLFVEHTIQKNLREIRTLRENEKYKNHLEAMIIERTQKLEEANIALNVIISNVEKEKSKIKENIAINIEKNIIPIIDNLKKNSSINENTYSRLMQNLGDLSDDFYKKIVQLNFKLTPTEIEVCKLIQNGNSGKEIANMLNVALSTIGDHKKNIRKKFNITNTKTNLRIYLAEII